MPQIFNLQRLILACAAFAIMTVASSTAWADPITITLGNPGNQNTDNVAVFQIDENSGKLSQVGDLINVPAAVCVKFLAAE